MPNSSPASATIRKDLLSQDSESFFAHLENSYIVVIFRVRSVSVCSVWAANRAARAKIGSESRSTRRQPADESPLKVPIPQCTSHTGNCVRGYFCGCVDKSSYSNSFCETENLCRIRILTDLWPSTAYDIPMLQKNTAYLSLTAFRN